MREIDLMIGKYYNHNGNWNYADHKGVFEFTSSDFYAILESTLDIKDIEPIPLTEELLLKCGFEIDGVWINLVYPIEHKRYIGFDLANNHLFLGQYDSQNKFRDVFLYKCENLHSLQNIFFALTNQELKINL